MAQLSLIPLQPKHTTQVEEIFWLTCSALPKEEGREAFKKKYLDDYLTLLSFVAIQHENVVGYILCQPHADLAPYGLEAFKDFWPEYPAHLHINTHPGVQGQGVGGELLSFLERELAKKAIKGVHLITHAEARNVLFYEKNHYKRIHETVQKLLMLGKKL